MNSFILVLILASTSALGPTLGGPWCYLTAAAAFMIIPFLDALINRPLKKFSENQSSLGFDLILWLFVFFQLAIICYCGWIFTQKELLLYEKIGVVLSVGIVTGGLGITIAHELIHRTSRIQKALGEFLLITVCYSHFAVEHVLGHHTFVATRTDPATSRFGESFYRFLPRTLIMGYLSAWTLEAKRLRRRNQNLLLNNHMIWYHALTGIWLFTMVQFFGFSILAFLFAQSIVAVLQLELINYVEHYGLTRNEISPGRFERVQEGHSWDSDRWLTNKILVNLQLHADHHMHPTKAYQKLEPMSKSPKLPMGYPTMLLIALMPPLWFRLMNFRVTEFRQQA